MIFGFGTFALFLRLTRAETLSLDLLGFKFLLTLPVMALCAVALFAWRDRSGSLWRLLLLVLVACYGAFFAIGVGGALYAGRAGVQAGALLPVVYALLALTPLWTFGAARQAFRSHTATLRPNLRAGQFAFVSLVALAIIPSWDSCEEYAKAIEIAQDRIRRAEYEKPSPAQLANWADRRRASERRAAAIEAAQPSLLEAELARLTPRAPKKPNLFVVGVAGWSDQKVFLKETEASLDIIRKRLHAEGKTLELVNNEATATAHPFADIQNLAHVLRSVAAKMNREEDVLLLAMTSHGSQDGLALDFGAVVERTLQPETLRALLDAAGVKNRIIIVSACHSGVFVPALSDPRTMVITAARAERSSFGCADDRDWTYFGDAFFAHGMSETPSLTEAFVKARDLVAQWEKEQKFAPSEPQIFVGDELRRRFPALVGPAEALATRLRETRSEGAAAAAKRLQRSAMATPRRAEDGQR